MEEFTAYHVVTERPMSVGQHIIFDEEHHSGVYTRVMGKLSIVEDIYNDPEKYEGQELEHHVSVALRELALEEVRKEKYPEYPSRMSCLYVSESFEEAERWAEYFMKLGRPVYSIVKLKIHGNKFIGDAEKCFKASVNRQNNLKLAERYWQNRFDADGKTPVKEILVDGDIEVVEIVQNIKEM